ncbi:Chromodomain helicase hrp3, partial [Diplonema papillatum]
ASLPPVIACCSKTVILDKLLAKWKSEGRKALVFTQWTRVLDVLEECLNHRKYAYVRLDGTVTGAERQAAITKFNNPDDKETFVFLLTTRAGGVGLNLTVADRVVIYDTDWNPQQDLQAAARVHRLGQENEVMIFRLISTNTFEEKMVETASKKLALSTSVLGGPARDAGNPGAKTGLSDGEMREFLKHGAYRILKEASLKDGSAKADQALFQASADEILSQAGKGAVANALVSEIKLFSEVNVTAKAGGDPAGDNDVAYWKRLFDDACAATESRAKKAEATGGAGAGGEGEEEGEEDAKSTFPTRLLRSPQTVLGDEEADGDAGPAGSSKDGRLRVGKTVKWSKKPSITGGGGGGRPSEGGRRAEPPPKPALTLSFGGRSGAARGAAATSPSPLSAQRKKKQEAPPADGPAAPAGKRACTVATGQPPGLTLSFGKRAAAAASSSAGEADAKQSELVLSFPKKRAAEPSSDARRATPPGKRHRLSLKKR